MVVLCTVTQVVYGAAIASTFLETRNDLYSIHPNRFLYNLLVGGLTHALLNALLYLLKIRRNF